MKKSSLKNLHKVLLLSAVIFMGAALTGCFNDPESTAEKYREWKEKNEAYVAEQELLTNPDGTPYYRKIVPSWAPDAYALVHWYNDPALTENNLSPMDNSTVSITYELFDIEDKRLSDSFSSTDSLYTSRPSQNIVGVWAPLTHMHVGDSVRIIIPYQAGYGEIGNGTINPYSTLVYNIKLKKINAYEIP